MNYEKQTIHFFIAILSLIFLLILCNMLSVSLQKDQVKTILAEHDRAVVSTLLEQGVSKKIAAEAITSHTVTIQGKDFLSRLGISEKTDIRFLPPIQDFISAISRFTIAWTAVFSGLLLAAAALFVIKRERLYQRAVKTINRCIDSDFSTLLPQTENGTIYQLFARINTMATSLKSGQETETRTKEFLKNTISDISHQLKTPLAALSMYIEIIRDDPHNAEAVAAFARKGQNAAERMEQLITTLLKLTRLDAGGITFHQSDYDVAEVIAQAAAELTDRAGREDKTIQIEGNAVCKIRCDLEWTREAIENIIKNALDHTSAGGMICIAWEQTPLRLRVSISDNGKGIAPEDIHHIFKRFYRSKHSLDTQGTGLGLPLAKSIIEEQGGSVTVRSKYGEGTEFVLAFPAYLTEL